MNIYTCKITGNVFTVTRSNGLYYVSNWTISEPVSVYQRLPKSFKRSEVLA